MINKQFYTSKWLIPIFVISVLIFTLLTVGVMHHTSFIQHIDAASLQLMTDYFGTPECGFEGSWFNTIMTFCATIGEVSSVMLLMVLLSVVIAVKSKRTALWSLIAVFTGSWMNFLIKQVIARSRPYNHLPQDHGFSYPSGHSNASTLICIVIIIMTVSYVTRLYAKWTIISLALLFWIGILSCRLYFHAHYVGDVLGGVALAVIWMMLFLAMYPLFYIRNKQ